jgi:transposase
MNRSQTSLDPLAHYLEPRFGDIYSYELEGVDGPNAQRWPAELRDAVKQYLLVDGPAQLITKAFPRGNGESANEWAEDIFEAYAPWEVAYDLHLEAVRAVPYLDELVGYRRAWLSKDERTDAAVWLEEHASQSDLQQMANGAKANDSLWKGYPGNLEYVLVAVLNPTALLRLWHGVSETRASRDLTDAEWQLIKPFVPARSWELPAARSAVDGMLQRSANSMPWSAIPIRYGDGGNIYRRHYNYQRSGVFARMLEALGGKPEASRLVGWLLQDASASDSTSRAA